MEEIRLLESLTGKKVILEENNLLIPRRTGEERENNYKIIINKKIQEYIKNGSKGDLDLSDTSLRVLPNNLEVGRDLFLNRSNIAFLPDDLKVNGTIWIKSSPLEKNPRLIEKYKQKYNIE